MNNEREDRPRDLDLEKGVADLVHTAVSVTNETSAVTHTENMLAELAKLIRVPSGIPPIGVDAALKVSKCFEIVAADIRAIAADRVKAAMELQEESESYAVTLLEAGKFLAGKVSEEAARAYKLSQILREAREIIAGPTHDTAAND